MPTPGLLRGRGSKSAQGSAAAASTITSILIPSSDYHIPQANLENEIGSDPGPKVTKCMTNSYALLTARQLYGTDLSCGQVAGAALVAFRKGLAGPTSSLRGQSRPCRL